MSDKEILLKMVLVDRSEYQYYLNGVLYGHGATISAAQRRALAAYRLVRRATIGEVKGEVNCEHFVKRN